MFALALVGPGEVINAKTRVPNEFLKLVREEFPKTGASKASRRKKAPTLKVRICARPSLEAPGLRERAAREMRV